MPLEKESVVLVVTIELVFVKKYKNRDYVLPRIYSDKLCKEICVYKLCKLS